VVRSAGASPVIMFSGALPRDAGVHERALAHEMLAERVRELEDQLKEVARGGKKYVEEGEERNSDEEIRALTGRIAGLEQTGEAKRRELEEQQQRHTRQLEDIAANRKEEFAIADGLHKDELRRIQEAKNASDRERTLQAESYSRQQEKLVNLSMELGTAKGTLEAMRSERDGLRKEFEVVKVGYEKQIGQYIGRVEEIKREEGRARSDGAVDGGGATAALLQAKLEMLQQERSFGEKRLEDERLRVDKLERKCEKLGEELKGAREEAEKRIKRATSSVKDARQAAEAAVKIAEDGGREGKRLRVELERTRKELKESREEAEALKAEIKAEIDGRQKSVEMRESSVGTVAVDDVESGVDVKTLENLMDEIGTLRRELAMAEASKEAARRNLESTQTRLQASMLVGKEGGKGDERGREYEKRIEELEARLGEVEKDAEGAKEGWRSCEENLKRMTARAERLEDELEAKGGGGEVGGNMTVEIEAEVVALRAEKKAFLSLQNDLTADAQRSSLELAEQMGKEVTALRKAKEEYKLKEAKNRKKRDEQVQRLKEEYEEKLELVKAATMVMEREEVDRGEVEGIGEKCGRMEVEMLGKGGGGGVGGDVGMGGEFMRASLQGQKSMVELARIEANELVETFAATIGGGGGIGSANKGRGGGGGEEGGEEERGEGFGQIVGQLRRELRKQEAIEQRLRSSYGK